MKNKNRRTLALALCVSIFFACLFASVNTGTHFKSPRHEANHMTPIHSTILSWENFTWESIERLTQRNSLFEQYIIKSHSRVPMRLPVPPILLLGCFLLFYYYKKALTRKGCFFLQEKTASYTIRYIHNQDGEIYHSFLF